MGQAKQRGTYEQRKAQAIDKKIAAQMEQQRLIPIDVPAKAHPAILASLMAYLPGKPK